MSINIIPDLVPSNHPILGGKMEPKYIVIHNTGNPLPGANAEMHGRFIRSQAAIDAYVLWHFTVDDKEIRQHVPISRNGWHASDGDGPGNMTGIAIEICENGDDAKAEANAALLVAHLIKTVPSLLPFPECVKQHYDFARDKKNCPRVIRGRQGGWEGFLAAVKDNLGPVTPPLRVTHNGEVIPDCVPTRVDNKVRVNLRPVIESLQGRVVESLTWDEETQTVNVLSHPERKGWLAKFIPR